ncbi:hypothetical protein B0H66DRAFT_530849 [Apodospora peruviana]|uniref:Uncharacterized protein n=1 Tax=Apodospora peruviana TaxID=516989 RepID=A0AAE0IKJ4_9PEZI|nr:hypothetical protein B0H66DRAFT_530849 [Apodospora peruviana]
MPSSITTAIPTGILSDGPDWCIQGLIDIFTSEDGGPYFYNECANSTRGDVKTDFETLCCDGPVIDASRSLWSYRGNFSSYPLDIENLVCCREGGQLLPGGIGPIDNVKTQCEYGAKPTPLASVAATNSHNAMPFLVTYESALAGTADWTVTNSPTCLWINTVHPDVTMVEVTVPAAEITTLPPPTTDKFGNTIVTSTSSSSETVTEGRPSGSTTSTSSSAGARLTTRLSRASAIIAAVLCLNLLSNTWQL